jgi:hypothetical protein
MRADNERREQTSTSRDGTKTTTTCEIEDVEAQIGGRIVPRNDGRRREEVGHLGADHQDEPQALLNVKEMQKECAI